MVTTAVATPWCCPDDRVLILGSVVPSTGNVDAAVFLYTASGQLDTSFNGTGHKTYSFGRPDEAGLAPRCHPMACAWPRSATALAWTTAPPPTTTRRC